MTDRGSFGMYDPAMSSYGSSTLEDFTRLSKAVGSNIVKINNSVSQMQSLLNSSDGRHDASKSTDKLLEMQHYTNQLAKETNKMAKELNQLSPASSPSEQKQQKMQRDRLVNEFTKALNNFQAVQRLEKEREKANMVKAKASSPRYDPFSESRLGFNVDQETVSFMQPQQQSVIQIEANDVDLEMMAEREEALGKLERDIVDVNEIFKILGTLVNEQGETIDTIEANVESASLNPWLEQGMEQLQQAKDYQSKSRRKKCIVISTIGLLSLVVLAIIIFLIISTPIKQAHKAHTQHEAIPDEWTNSTESLNCTTLAYSEQ